MKSKTSDVLNSEMYGKAFLFNSYRGKEIKNLLQPFEKLISAMTITKVRHGRLYRGRRINIEEDVDSGKGITMKGGILLGGFNEENSRIAPPEKCGLERLNRRGHPVFYVAEEKSTAINEQKAQMGDAISVAEFDLVAEISVLDFSAYTREEQERIISDSIENDFSKKNNHSGRQLYFWAQKYLTIIDSTEDFYETSNCFADIMKRDNRIAGVRYYSAYMGHNIAIWGYKENDYKFCGSHIEIIGHTTETFKTDEK